MPFTNGSSGPTTTISIFFSFAKALIASKSVALMLTFSPTAVVPAFPGAMYSFSTFGLWAIFHASACSRPPEPSNNIFIFVLLYYKLDYYKFTGISYRYELQVLFKVTGDFLVQMYAVAT